MSKNSKGKNDKRKFSIIAKVGNTTFVKYRCNNIDNCIKFILNKYPDFRYANIFNKLTRVQINSYTKLKGFF
jgi:hypothetical protein